MGAFSHIAHAVKTDIGRKRKNNEDSFGVFPEVGVFCVADGMGGGDDGEVASAATVRALESFAKEFQLPEQATYASTVLIEGIRAHLNAASAWILRRAKEKHLKGCGSTFVGICFDASHPEMATALHAGDSRLYRIRGRSIQQMTKDHSAAELIGAKDESELNPMFRGMILRAVGIQTTVQIDETPVPLKEGDRILICSDGLSRMVSDAKMLSIVRKSGSVTAAVDALIDAANAAGGVDNVTVELLEIGNLPAPMPVVERPRVPELERQTGSTDLEESDTSDTDGESGLSFEPSDGIPSTDASVGSEVSLPILTIPEAPKDEAGVGPSDGDLARASSKSFPTGTVVRATVLALVIAVGIGSTILWRAAESRRIEELRQRDDAQKAAETERLAEAERLRAEEQRKCAEEAVRIERELKAKEDAERRLAQEKQEAERRARAAAEEALKRQAAEEAERRVKAAAEEALKRQAEEAARVERERRAAEEAERCAKAAAEEVLKRQAEEAARVERERRAAEEARIVAERQLAEARERAERQKRSDTLQALERVCEEESARAFVNKLLEKIADEVPESLNTRFRPLWTSSKLSQSEKIVAAVNLTKDVQLVTGKLAEYAKLYLADVEDELADAHVSAERRKELAEVLKDIRRFQETAARLDGRDPSDPDVQFSCSVIIHNVPLWF